MAAPRRPRDFPRGSKNSGPPKAKRRSGFFRSSLRRFAANRQTLLVELLRQHLAAQALVQALDGCCLLALADCGRLFVGLAFAQFSDQAIFSIARRKRRIATSNGSFSFRRIVVMSFLNCLNGQKRSGQAPRTGHPSVPTNRRNERKYGLGGRKREAESTASTLHKPRAAPRLTASRHAENGRGLTEISIQPAIIAGNHRQNHPFVDCVCTGERLRAGTALRPFHPASRRGGPK
ncbi:hypothetical protein C7S13_0884 [Burkholderia cepacia]|nr:hypothetical protein [Burkholderia cepacia]